MKISTRDIALLRTIARDGYDPNEPRDTTGQWTVSGVEGGVRIEKHEQQTKDPGGYGTWKIIDNPKDEQIEGLLHRADSHEVRYVLIGKDVYIGDASHWDHHWIIDDPSFHESG